MGNSPTSVEIFTYQCYFRINSLSNKEIRQHSGEHKYTKVQTHKWNKRVQETRVEDITFRGFASSGHPQKKTFWDLPPVEALTKIGFVLTFKSDFSLFLLVRIRVFTWSKQFHQVGLFLKGTQSNAISYLWNPSRISAFHTEEWDKANILKQMSWSDMSSSVSKAKCWKWHWIKSVCVRLTVLGLLGIARPFGKRVILVLCQEAWVHVSHNIRNLCQFGILGQQIRSKDFINTVR